MGGEPCETRRTATQLHQDVTARAGAQVHEQDQLPAQQVAAARARAVAAPVAPVVLPTLRPDAVAPAPGTADVDDDQELVLKDLTREQVLDWRARAAHDHQIVHDHIARYGEHAGQRLFARSFVATTQRHAGLGYLDLGYIPWGQA